MTTMTTMTGNATPPSAATIHNYVTSAAALMGLVLDAARAERVAAHFQRTAAMAALLDDAHLAPHDELTELFCPAPFPVAADTGDAPKAPGAA